MDAEELLLHTIESTLLVTKLHRYIQDQNDTLLAEDSVRLHAVEQEILQHQTRSHDLLSSISQSRFMPSLRALDKTPRRQPGKDREPWIKLPGEVVARVLEFNRPFESASDFARYALVCRRWIIPAQKVLVSRLCVRGSDLPCEYYPDKWPFEAPLEIRRVLAALCLRRVFRPMVWTFVGALRLHLHDEAEIPLLKGLARLVGPNLTELHIKIHNQVEDPQLHARVLGLFLHECPCLRSISLHSFDFDAPIREIELSKLGALEIIDPRGELSLLLDRVSMPGLHSLCHIESQSFRLSDRVVAGLCTFAKKCPGIRYLEVSLDRNDEVISSFLENRQSLCYFTSRGSSLSQLTLSNLSRRNIRAKSIK
ncbi:MAG: hypothetical protein SGCHY_000325 [Lobulomycetales sp.]